MVESIDGLHHILSESSGNWLVPLSRFDCMGAVGMQVTFYPGRYAIEKGSILPVGDPTQYISNAEVASGLCTTCFGRSHMYGRVARILASKHLGKKITPCAEPVQK